MTEYTPNPKIIVHDLGEDSEAWIVEGTMNVDIAREEAKAWIVNVYSGKNDADNRKEVLGNLNSTRATLRGDWFWKETLYGDYILTNLSKDKKEPRDSDMFSAVHLA